jgi:hypothetical protein
MLGLLLVPPETSEGARKGIYSEIYETSDPSETEVIRGIMLRGGGFHRDPIFLEAEVFALRARHSRYFAYLEG